MISKAVIMLAVLALGTASAEAKSPKKNVKPAVAEVVDWSARAASELEAAKLEPAVPPPKVSKSKKTVEVLEPVAMPEEVALTSATVLAEVRPTHSIIERTALRFTFLFEQYRPSGTAKLGSGQELSYSDLPMSALGQVDLRWLPFEMATISGRSLTLGGYTAVGFARSKVPLVAASGFRYDDVALNTLRYEAGIASGYGFAPNWNLEARFGFGRSSVMQTSRYTEVVGTFDRPCLVGALDLSYYVMNRFALVASLSRRSPFGDGTGSLGFDPLTVSGGFLVQVR